MMDVERAQRRRGRRLRAALRHERCRVPAPHLTRSENGKGQGGGARGERRATATEAPLLPRRSSSCSMRRTLTRRCGRPAWPSRGDHRKWVQLRTVEHITDVVLVVQILDIPVPQKVERLADFLVLLDTQTPVEQVIAVPKISNDSNQPRLVDCDLRRPQMAAQLVEEPTVLSYASLQQQTAEQIVDIPVEVFKVFAQDRFPTASSSFLDGEDEVFQWFSALFKDFKKCAVLRLVEQIIVLTLQFVLVSGHGGLQGSHPGQSSTSFSGAQHEVQGQGQGSTAPRGADSVGHRPPLPLERVAERLARIERHPCPGVLRRRRR